LKDEEMEGEDEAATEPAKVVNCKLMWLYLADNSVNFYLIQSI